MLKPQNAIIHTEYSYLLADIEVRQDKGRGKHVGCNFFWGARLSEQETGDRRAQFLL